MLLGSVIIVASGLYSFLRERTLRAKVEATGV
jgi:hypothetical protein